MDISIVMNYGKDSTKAITFPRTVQIALIISPNNLLLHKFHQHGSSIILIW